MNNTNENYKIYVHINKKNRKMYFGQTKQEPEKRWRSGLGYKDSPYFWRAIQKYGWNGFEHIVLVENLNQESADMFEEDLIKLYNTTNENFGYNLASGGNSPIMNEMAKLHCSQNHADVNGEKNPMYGKHHTEETKEKIRKTKEKYVRENATRYGAVLSDETKKKIGDSNRGRIISEETKRKISISNGKPVYQIDVITKQIIRKYYSITEASKITGIKHSQIGACCNDIPKYNKAGGFIWMFCEDYNQKMYSSEFMEIYKVICQYDENYNLVNKWGSLKDIKNNLGIKNTSWIRQLCNRKKFDNIFFGFHWRYDTYDEIIKG
jgi:group I intron endonuclease